MDIEQAIEKLRKIDSDLTKDLQRLEELQSEIEDQIENVRGASEALEESIECLQRFLPLEDEEVMPSDDSGKWVLR